MTHTLKASWAATRIKSWLCVGSPLRNTKSRPILVLAEPMPALSNASATSAPVSSIATVSFMTTMVPHATGDSGLTFSRRQGKTKRQRDLFWSLWVRRRNAIWVMIRGVSSFHPSKSVWPFSTTLKLPSDSEFIPEETVSAMSPIKILTMERPAMIMRKKTKRSPGRCIDMSNPPVNNTWKTKYMAVWMSFVVALSPSESTA
mmetsp:Transcript_42581/g.86094  ORF Transcript_42581/g.86094 Transcript_42581/m.86094 type:complete len:202 (+) Transcript_42581:145-750(+)